jgi:hypothetical protein
VHQKWIEVLLKAQLRRSFHGISPLGVTALFAVATLSCTSALLAQNSVSPTNLAPSHRLAQTSVFAADLQMSFLPATVDRTRPETSDSTSSIDTLPDAPGSNSPLPNAAGSSAADPHSGPRSQADPARPVRLTPIYDRYVEPYETAQHLTRTQSMLFGFHQSISPYFLVTILAAAGYEQAANSAPNYGTNIGSYGERLGAAAVRNTSQSVFADSLMAPLLHQDPRFYIQGTRHSVFERVVYAATRVVVTRSSDDGHLMPNYSEIAGYAEAAALTNAYYPDVNVGFGQTARSLGGSLLGVAVSNVVREFLPDILRTAHLQRFE